MKTRKLKMTDEAVQAMREQLEAFKKKFGRGDEPIFFDPDFDVPTKLTAEKIERILIKACKRAGIAPERILKQFE